MSAARHEAALPAVIADDPDPRRLTESVVEALAQRRPVAVLDGRWPAARRAAARDAVMRHQRRLRPADLVVFSSGSAGVPRAVHRSLASWERSAAALSDLLELRRDDVTYLPGHPASTLSLYAALHAIAAGSAVRFAGEPRADATIVHAVPSLVPAILQARRDGALPSLRVVVTAGDRVSAALAQGCARAGVRLVAYYGAAELSFVGLAEAEPTASGSCATMTYRAFPGVELDVRDGLLWSRSAYAAYGYLGEGWPEDELPDEGLPGDGLPDGGLPGPQRAGPLRRTSDGWACVGDAARWVAPGRVEILGRTDGAVTVAGHTVLVEEVELALLAHPHIADVVVVGVPDRVHGATLLALWTSRDPAEQDPAGPSTVSASGDHDGHPGGTGVAPDGVAAVLADLPVPARPRQWRHLPAHPGLPRTPAGKPDRAAARALPTAGLAASQRAAPAGGR